MQDKDDKPLDSVNEPIVNYGSMEKKRISFFKSFEEATEADYEFYRGLTGEQRINIHYELSIRVFGKPEPNPNRRFTF